MAMPEELITFKEAKEYLGISRAKMGRLAKEGSLSIYTDPLDKRKKLVPRAEVEKLKQPQAVKKETPALPLSPPAPAPKAETKPAAKIEKAQEKTKDPNHIFKMASCKCQNCGERFRAEFEWFGTLYPNHPDLQSNRYLWLADCPKCGKTNSLERPNWAPTGGAGGGAGAD